MSSAPETEPPTEASEPPEAGRPPAAEAPPKKKKLKAKAPPPPPLTEDEIDSPNRQTLGMLGVIGIMTLCMWVFARGGCNYHPPKETRDPRKVDLVDLARDPKDAALELQQRWATKSYGGALELVKGSLVEQLKREQASCDANSGCSQEASTLRGRVQTVAALLERDMTRSVARVTSYGVSANPERYIITLERDQQIWKAVSRVVDDGSFKPHPAPQVAPHEREGNLLMRLPGMPAAASSSSAAPNSSK